jgi:DNA-binding MarR family transcriptional regulator
MTIVPAPSAPPSTSADAKQLAPALRLGVMRLARRLRQEHAPGEVTPSMLSALSTIERLGPITLGDLAAVEQVQPPSMTRIVSRLEEQGLVARTGDQSDRRVFRVAVTADGRRFVARSRTRKDAYLARRLDELDDTERGVLAQALPILERLVGGDE